MTNTSDTTSISQPNQCGYCEFGTHPDEKLDKDVYLVRLPDGWGMGPTMVHVACEEAEANRRRKTAVFLQLGWVHTLDRATSIALKLDLPYWLLEEGLECCVSEEGEVAALIAADGVSHDVLLALVAQSMEPLTYTLIWNAPWIEEDGIPWVAITRISDGTTHRVRSLLPWDGCFVCGESIRSGHSVDYRSRGLGRAHSMCLRDARALAWHDLARSWHLTDYGGPFCVHCIGTDWTDRMREYHLAQCPHVGARSHPTLDHLRVWLVGEDSPWTSFVAAGSLLATSEPYVSESFPETTKLVDVADVTLRVVLYNDLQLHNPDRDAISETVLHVWIPTKTVEETAA